MDIELLTSTKFQEVKSFRKLEFTLVGIRMCFRNERIVILPHAISY